MRNVIRASAKANGLQLYPQTLRYATNHEAWRNELRKFGSLVHFGGLVLTGWSRSVAPPHRTINAVEVPSCVARVPTVREVAFT